MKLIEPLIAFAILASPLIVALALAAVAEDRDGRTRLVISGGRVRRHRGR